MAPAVFKKAWLPLERLTTAQEVADALPVTRRCRARSLGWATSDRWHVAGLLPEHDIDRRGHLQPTALAGSRMHCRGEAWRSTTSGSCA
jgi:hypothetical protein